MKAIQAWVLDRLPATRDELVALFPGPPRYMDISLSVVSAEGYARQDGATYVRTDRRLPARIEGRGATAHAVRPAFVRWKQTETPPADVSINWATLDFTSTLARRQFTSYVKALDTHLPEVPPPAVLEAMASNGVRADWAPSIYREMREALLR